MKHITIRKINPGKARPVKRVWKADQDVAGVPHFDKPGMAILLKKAVRTA